MSPPRIRRRRSPNRWARTAVPRPSTVSGDSYEAIARFVRILARCGATPNDIVRAARAEAARIPGNWAVRAGRVARNIDDAGHVLTVWFSEAAYLDASGRPLALPLEGAPKSVAALVRAVDPTFNAREVLTYLIRSGAVRREGRRYVPRSRALFIRGVRGPDYYHTLRLLTNALATLEHNVLPKRTVPGWFAYPVHNPHFPVRQREMLDKYVAAIGKEILSRIDTYLRRCEVNRRPDEPTVRVGIDMHLWEGEPERRSPLATPGRTTARARRPEEP